MDLKKLWNGYNLALVLATLFLVSWVFQGVTGWQEFKADEATHQQDAVLFGADGYLWNFLESTFENWQSEFLQLLAFVVLTSFLVFRGSPESRDGQDDMMETLDRIERRLDALSGSRESKAG